MPSSKDPTAWAIVLAWIIQNAPVIYATGLSVLISALRIVYRGGSRKGPMVILEFVACSSTATRLHSLQPTKRAATAPVRGAATYRVLGR